MLFKLGDLNFEPNSFQLSTFKILLKQLFVDFDESDHDKMIIDLFNQFDKDKDGELNKLEFEFMWMNWVKKLINLKFALIVVDMQNDFITGSLAIKNCAAKQDGKFCVPVINQLINDVKFCKIVYTLDWHPKDHISFYSNFQNYKIVSLNGKQEFSNESIKLFDKVEFKVNDKIVEQILWPVHCVADSEGAKLHKDLIVKDDQNSIKILKGTSKDCDSYSAFFDNYKKTKTELSCILKEDKIEILFISGLATDYCVYETADDALNLGFLTILIEDACKGVDEKTIEETKTKLKNKGCIFIRSNQVKKIVNSHRRSLEIGLYFLKSLNF